MQFSRKTHDAAASWLDTLNQGQYRYGFMGKPNSDGSFTLDVPGEPGMVYVRVWQGDTLTIDKATNQGAILNPHLMVRMMTVGGELVVERPVPQMARAMYGAYASTAAVPPHFQGPGAPGLVADVTPGEQFAPGLLRPVDPASLSVLALPFWYGGSYYENLTVDLTSHVPGTADTSRWAVVTFVPASGTLSALSSADSYLSVHDLPPALADAVSVPAAHVPLGAVALTAGQTVILNTTPILDMRHYLATASASGGAELRNLIFNGDFQVWQAGGSLPAADGVGPDMWGAYGILAAGSVNVEQTSTGKPEYPYAARLQNQSAVATLDSADWVALRGEVEGVGLAGAFGKNLTLTFSARASKAGTYCVTLANVDGYTDLVYVKEFTLTGGGTWDDNLSVTFPLDDSLFTDDALQSPYFAVYFVMAAGSDYLNATVEDWTTGFLPISSSQVNALDNATHYLDITAVRLTVSDAPVSVEPRSFWETLGEAGSAIQKSYDLWDTQGAPVSAGEVYFCAVSTTKLVGNVRFPVQMYRSSGSEARVYSSAGTADCVSDLAGTDVGAAATIGRLSLTGFCEIDDAGAPYTAGDWYRFMYFVR